MNNTLNNLALLSFERRARKMNATIRNFTRKNLSYDLSIKKGESIILWSLENGFQEEICTCDSLVVTDITFGEKYENDYIFHFGIYNPKFKTITVFRTYDQIHSNKELIIYDLKFFVDQFYSIEFQTEIDMMAVYEGY